MSEVVVTDAGWTAAVSLAVAGRVLLQGAIVTGETESPTHMFDSQGEVRKAFTEAVLLAWAEASICPACCIKAAPGLIALTDQFAAFLKDHEH